MIELLMCGFPVELVTLLVVRYKVMNGWLAVAVLSACIAGGGIIVKTDAPIWRYKKRPTRESGRVFAL